MEPTTPPNRTRHSIVVLYRVALAIFALTVIMPGAILFALTAIVIWAITGRSSVAFDFAGGMNHMLIKLWSYVHSYGGRNLQAQPEAIYLWWTSRIDGVLTKEVQQELDANPLSSVIVLVMFLSVVSGLKALTMWTIHAGSIAQTMATYMWDLGSLIIFGMLVVEGVTGSIPIVHRLTFLCHRCCQRIAALFVIVVGIYSSGSALNVLVGQPDQGLMLLIMVMGLQLVFWLGGVLPLDMSAPRVPTSQLDGEKTPVLIEPLSDSDEDTIAAHEAGHVLVHAALPVVPLTLHASLTRQGGSLGRVHSVDQADIKALLPSRTWMEWLMYRQLSGRVASHILMGEEMSGNRQDLMEWEELARQYLTNGFGPYLYHTPHSEAEALANAHTLDAMQKSQLGDVGKFLRLNHDVLRDLRTVLQQQRELPYEELLPYLERVQIPADFPRPDSIGKQPA